MESTNDSANIEETCCFTGHRIIETDNIDEIRNNLSVVIERLYDEGVRRFITGGALGFDTEAALAVIRMRKKLPEIRLTIAIPCQEQYKPWRNSQQELYKEILEDADQIVYVSETYLPGCMHKRNRYMVDNSGTVVAYINQTKGGTAYTVSYAVDKERRIINILDI